MGKLEKMIQIMKAYSKKKFTGKVLINFSNGTPVALELTSKEKL